QVPATQRKSYELTVSEGLSSGVTTAELQTSDLNRWLTSERLPQRQRAALRAALRPLLEHEAMLKKRRELRTEIDELDGRLERLGRALSVVRHADGEDAELLSRRVVDSEERRARLTRELAKLDPYPALARAKRELAKLNDAIPSD